MRREGGDQSVSRSKKHPAQSWPVPNAVSYTHLDVYKRQHVRMERQGAHRFVTEVVEAFPGEIEAISVSKPALEDVFIRRTGHKFWSEKTEVED